MKIGQYDEDDRLQVKYSVRLFWSVFLLPAVLDLGDTGAKLDAEENRNETFPAS